MTVEMIPTVSEAATPAGGAKRKIDAVVICSFRYDQHFLRICIASVRYWYPDIPIFLLKDEGRGPFSTDEVERTHNAQVLETRFSKGGWGLTKIEALFGSSPKRILLLDSDTVLMGRVIDRLEAWPEDFIVTGVVDEDPSFYLISRDYIDVEAVKRDFDPDYDYPGFGFNSGHLVITRDLLDRSDFDGLVDFSENGFRAVAPKGLFPYADQGILNYVLAKKRKDGVTVRHADFWCWSGLPEAKQFSLDGVRRHQDYGMIIHWAGTKKHVLSSMDRSDILMFFEQKYYTRVPAGPLVRRWRAIRRMAGKAWGGIARMTGLE